MPAATAPLSAPVVRAVRRCIETEGVKPLARKIGISPITLTRAAAGAPVTPTVALKASRLRTAEDFERHIHTPVPEPRERPPILSWTMDQIRDARDDQLRGSFYRPSKLAEAMRTDDALFTAYHTRLAPHDALQAQIQSAGGVAGDRLKAKAAAGVVLPRAELQSIIGDYVNHGVAFAQVIHDHADDGSRIDMRLTHWPIEHVKWDTHRRTYMTHVDNGAADVPITHGDGQWIVFAKHATKPWTHEACVLPGAGLWGARAYGLLDWGASAASHGQAKVVGELPEGLSTHGNDGELTPRTQAFLTMLQDMVSGNAGAGVFEHGNKVQFLANGSTAWQVFDKLILNRDTAAARIYLGTDGTLGSKGGAPGVDIATLFGIATTKLQGDLNVLISGVQVGLFDPWAALNFGSARHAPSLSYELPDPDKDAKLAAQGERHAGFFKAVSEYEARGFVVDQGVINMLAQQYGVEAPEIAATQDVKIKLELAPTDVAKVVRVREARAAQGLPPFGDDRDDLTLGELEERAKSTGGEADEQPPEQPPSPVLPAPSTKDTST